MVTVPSSRGWRNTSIAFLENSGSSSRNKTPLWANEISPGFGMFPPPERPAAETVWWGARKGRVWIKEVFGGIIPAMECSFVVSMVSSNVIGGKIEGKRFASILFPEPGGPISSTLWPPLAAISNARFAWVCPRTSAKSGKAGDAKSILLWGIWGNMVRLPVRWSISCFTFVTGYTSNPSTTAPSAALTAGTNKRWYPNSLAWIAIGSTPRIPWISPDKDNSPIIAQSERSQESCPDAVKIASSMGRS